MGHVVKGKKFDPSAKSMDTCQPVETAIGHNRLLLVNFLQVKESFYLGYSRS